MSNPFEVNEDPSFTIGMSGSTFNVKGRGTITAKQQKREIGNILKATGEAFLDIRQDDMAEFFITAGKQLVGRGGGRKPKTSVSISDDDAVDDNDDTDNTPVEAATEVTDTAPTITSSPNSDLELEDSGYEEVV